MKKYFIILSGLCFSQMQAMAPEEHKRMPMPVLGIFTLPAGGGAPTIHPLFARVPAPIPKSPPSLATLAMRNYRGQIANQKIKLEEVQKLFPSTQMIIKDAMISDPESSSGKKFSDIKFFPTIKLKHATRVTAVAFHPQGEHFAVGEESGRITIYNKIGNIVKSFIAPCTKDAPPAIIHLDLCRLKDNFILVSKLFQAPQLLDTDGNLIVTYDEEPRKEKSFWESYLEIGNYANQLFKEGYLEIYYPSFILDILKQYSSLSLPWKSQSTLVARFSSNLEFVIGSNLYSDKDCSFQNLKHHRDEPHRHKTLNIWDINGNRFHFFPRIYGFCMGFLEDEATIGLSANIELIGQKKFIKEHDELRTIAKTGKFALSVHKNKAYLQSLFIGTLRNKPSDFTLDQLLFLDSAWSPIRTKKEGSKIKKEYLAEQRQLKKGCSVS